MEVEAGTERRTTRQLMVGDVPVGGGAPITVQSMTVTRTADHEATLQQIYDLAMAGADIVRCTCNEPEAAEGLARIVPRSPVPIVADIHHQYRMALAALEAGVHCLRLNPGNIRDSEKVQTIVQEAKARQVPIRIGVNFGSLPPVGAIGVTRGQHRHSDGVNRLLKGADSSGEGDSISVVDHMVATGLWEIQLLEDLDFDLIKVSLKAYDIDTLSLIHI